MISFTLRTTWLPGDKRKRRAMLRNALCAHCGQAIRLYSRSVACPTCDWTVPITGGQERQMAAALWSGGTLYPWMFTLGPGLHWWDWRGGPRPCARPTAPPPTAAPGRATLYIFTERGWSHIAAGAWVYGPCAHCGRGTLFLRLNDDAPAPVVAGQLPADFLCEACDLAGEGVAA